MRIILQVKHIVNSSVSSFHAITQQQVRTIDFVSF